MSYISCIQNDSIKAKAERPHDNDCSGCRSFTTEFERVNHGSPVIGRCKVQPDFGRFNRTGFAVTIETDYCDMHDPIDQPKTLEA